MYLKYWNLKFILKTVQKVNRKNKRMRGSIKLKKGKRNIRLLRQSEIK